MKTKLFLFIILFVGINIDNVLSISDQMAVQILPGDYTQPCEVRNLQNGVLKFMNTTIPITSVAPEFAGYKFLAMNTTASYKGKIVPSATGEIYIVASGTSTVETLMSTANWVKTNYTVTYFASNKTTTLYVYTKNVVLGDTVTIPISNNYAGIAPVAYNMSIKPDISTNERSINSDNSNYFLIKNNMLMFSERITHPVNVSIYNVDGRLVLQKNGIKSNDEVSTEMLEKGIYIIRLNLSSVSVSQKFLIN